MENDGKERHLVPLGIRFKAKRIIHKSRPKKVYFMIIALFLVAGGSVAYILMSTQSGGSVQTTNILGNSVSSIIGGGKLSDEEVIKKVGKLTVLPQNETPTVAVIGDISQFSDQIFFANSRNEDVVLVYEKAKRVIIYRPSENKIIETGTKVEPTPTPEVEEVIEIEAEVTPTPIDPTPTLIEEGGESTPTGPEASPTEGAEE